MNAFTAAFDQPAPARAPPQSIMTWRPRRGAKDQPPLRLVGATRGNGTLIRSGVAVAVNYELDLFARGAVRLASGSLEGDFSASGATDPDDIPPERAQLRLAGGRELEIELIALGAVGAEFDASGAAVSRYMLSQPIEGDGRRIAPDPSGAIA